MVQENIALEKFSVIGISIRTSNKEALTDLPKVWERFFSEAIMEKIPGRLNSDIIAVYTGYEGDHTNPYTFILGCEVSQTEPVPEGMRSVTIPPARYIVFPVTGSIPGAVAETWYTIWNDPVGKKRAYIADFERYRFLSGNAQPPDVKIYIGTT